MSSTKPSILLVEDDHINAIVMQHYFEEMYNFSHEADGNQVINTLKNGSFDVVIMDINLGKNDVDGTKLIKVIRNDEQLKHLKVFALTGYAMRGDEEMFITLGFDKYIPKPVDFKFVDDSIQQALHQN